jgi:hypothetical protein
MFGDPCLKNKVVQLSVLLRNRVYSHILYLMCPKCTVNIGAQLDVNNSSMERTRLPSLAGTISVFF